MLGFHAAKREHLLRKSFLLGYSQCTCDVLAQLSVSLTPSRGEESHHNIYHIQGLSDTVHSVQFLYNLMLYLGIQLHLEGVLPEIKQSVTWRECYQRLSKVSPQHQLDRHNKQQVIKSLTFRQNNSISIFQYYSTVGAFFWCEFSYMRKSIFLMLLHLVMVNKSGCLKHCISC